jgi:hypothetical protein
MAARKAGTESVRSKAARPAEPETATEIARMESEGGAQSAPGSAAPDYKKPAVDQASGKPGLAANKARQGVTGQGVKYVLGFSLAGAVAVLLLVYFWVY